MIRRVIVVTAVFFLLFCAIVAACSRWGGRYPLAPPPGSSRWLLLNDGLLAYEHNYGPTAGPLHWVPISAWLFHSGDRIEARSGNRVGYWFVDLSIAALVLYPLVLILVTWRFLRGAPQRRPGLCPSCGYDLRASKNRCPECGTEINGDSPE